MKKLITFTLFIIVIPILFFLNPAKTFADTTRFDFDKQTDYFEKVFYSEDVKFLKFYKNEKDYINPVYQKEKLRYQEVLRKANHPNFIWPNIVFLNKKIPINYVQQTEFEIANDNPTVTQNRKVISEERYEGDFMIAGSAETSFPIKCLKNKLGLKASFEKKVNKSLRVETNYQIPPRSKFKQQVVCHGYLSNGHITSYFFWVRQLSIDFEVISNITNHTQVIIEEI